MQRHVTVAPASWWHLPRLSHLIRETRRRRAAGEDAPGQATVWAPRWSPSLALLQSVWAAPVPGVQVPLSYVAELDHKPVGLGQLRPRREPHQWEVAYLAIEPPPTPEDGVPPLRLVPDRNTARLLGALCDAAEGRHGDRVLARVADGGGRYELFRQVGFSLAVREYSYFRTLPPAAATGSKPRWPELARRIPGLRPQRRADAFGLLQLYQSNTPKTVQLVEGKRSLSWDVTTGALHARWSRRRGVERWVVERDGRPAAWLQLQRVQRGPHQLRVITDERSSELNQSLVDFVLDALAGDGDHGVLVRVREHQTRLIGALESSQFFLVDSYLLMVKMLATPVLQPSFAPVLEKVV